MATNQDGHLLDSAGNVAVDFVWGNFPLQPNDIRRDNGGTNLNYALDSHNIAEDGWNGYPLYTPNTTGTQSGGVDYVKVPSVLGQLTADATDTLLDSTLVASVQSAATNAAKTVTAIARSSGSPLLVFTASGAGAAYAVGTKVVVSSFSGGDAFLNGTYAVVDNGTNTFTVSTPADTSAVSLSGKSGAVVGLVGTIKAQGTAAGTSVAVGVTVTTTPWAAAS
jgi:hypothetical protein